MKVFPLKKGCVRGGIHTWLRLLLISWWLLVEKGASFFEGCCDGLLPRGH